jgi:hypothetical protein
MIYDVVSLASDIIKPERNYTTDILLQWLKIKGVGLGYGRQLYFQCLLKYMVICAFDNPPQFQASWQHRLLTLDMKSFKIWLLFLLPFYSGAPSLFISYYW